MKRLAIIGAKDLGQLIAYHAKATSQFEVVGFFDDFCTAGEMTTNGPVLGKIADAIKHFTDNHFDQFILGIGYNHLDFRWKCYSELSQKIPAATLIHPSCYVDPSVQISSGCFLLPGCTLDAGVSIGENTLLNTSVSIAHDTTVGNNCFLGPGVNLTGFISVGSNCFLGAGTTVVDKIKINDQVQTGAGAVVTKSITESGLYVGVPAKKIR